MDPFLPGTSWVSCKPLPLFPFAVASLKMVFDPPSLRWVPPTLRSMSLRCRFTQWSLSLNVAVAQWSLRFTPLVKSLRSMSLPLNGRFARYVADAQCRYRSMVVAFHFTQCHSAPPSLRSTQKGLTTPPLTVGPPLAHAQINISSFSYSQF